jgi:EpsI family protein
LTTTHSTPVAPTETTLAPAVAASGGGPASPSRREAWIGLGLLGVAALAFAVEPRRRPHDYHEEDLAGLIPAQIGPWTAQTSNADIVPEADGVPAGVQQTVSRSYLAPGKPVVMLVATYHGPQSLDIKAHRPEVCYEAAGFQVAEMRPVGVDVGGAQPVPGTLFTGSRVGRVEHVLYWTRIADNFPVSMNGERMATLKQAFKGAISDGLLVRMSVVDQDREASKATMLEFARALVASSGPKAREMMFGSLTKTISAQTVPIPKAGTP